MDEGGLMVDQPAENFDKYFIVLGRGSLRESCKYRCLFNLVRGGGQVEKLPRTPSFLGVFPGGKGSGKGVGFGWIFFEKDLLVFGRGSLSDLCKKSY